MTHAAKPSHDQGPDRRGPTLAKRTAAGIAVLGVTVGVVIAVYEVGGGGEERAVSLADADEAEALIPADRARVRQLMRKLSEDPEDAGTLLAIGNVYHEAGDDDTAGDWISRAVSADPRDVSARLALGATRFNLGEVSEAEGQWLRAIDLDPKGPEAYYNLGFLYVSEDPPDMARAERMWRKVIQLAPGSSLAKVVATHLEGLGEAQAKTGTKG